MGEIYRAAAGLASYAVALMARQVRRLSE